MAESVVIGFDFDGTLVDSQSAVKIALEEILPRYLHPDQEWSVRDVFHLNLDSLKQKFKFRDKDAFAAFRCHFVQRFDTEYFRHVTLMDGAQEVLQDLASRYGVSQLFVLTNRRASSVKQIARALNLHAYFNFIESVVPDGSANPKVPALEEALGRFERPFLSAYVGDHLNDAEAAIQTGSLAILYDPSLSLQQHPRAVHVAALKDIMKIMETHHEKGK